MAAELAISYILKSDSQVQSQCGTNPVRVFLNKLPQTLQYPAILVRRYGTTPNHTKDGPSQLDATRVQVQMFFAELNSNAYNLEQRVRTLCDRPATQGVVNNVNLESSAFEDDDTYAEQIVDKEVNVIEHIYRTLIKR